MNNSSTVGGREDIMDVGFFYSLTNVGQLQCVCGFIFGFAVLQCCVS